MKSAMVAGMRGQAAAAELTERLQDLYAEAAHEQREQLPT